MLVKQPLGNIIFSVFSRIFLEWQNFLIRMSNSHTQIFLWEFRKCTFFLSNRTDKRLKTFLNNRLKNIECCFTSSSVMLKFGLDLEVNLRKVSLQNRGMFGQKLNVHWRMFAEITFLRLSSAFRPDESLWEVLIPQRNVSFCGPRKIN